MKKFKYGILMAVVALIGFTSCSNDDEASGVDNSKPKSVYLKISNGPNTYAESPIVNDGDAVTFNDGHLYFVNAAGVILDYYTLTAGVTAGANISIADITTVGSTLQNLDGSITNIFVVGNVPAAVVLPTAGNISAVKAMALNVQTQGTSTNVSLYGTNTLTATGVADQYTSNILVSPIVARIELTDITAGGAIDDFDVEGIFVDYYYPTGRIDGTITSVLVQNGTVVADFADASAKYPVALKPSIYDWFAPLTSAAGVAAPAPGNVWGYNVFATAAGSSVPRIVIRLSNIQTNDGSVYANPQFVTIRGFKNAGAPLATVVGGSVYSIAAGALVIDENVLKPNPNQNEIEIEVGITLNTWTGVAVTPEF